MCPSAASLIPVGDREIALQLQALLEFSDFIEQRKPGPGLHNQNGWRPGPRPAKPYTLSGAVDIQVNSVIKIVRAGGRHRSSGCLKDGREENPRPSGLCCACR